MTVISETLLSETVFEVFVRQCWQISAVAVVVGLVTRLIRRRRPHLAYALWLLVLVKAVVPPVWGSPTSLLGWMEAGSRSPAIVVSEPESRRFPQAIVPGEPARPDPSSPLAATPPTVNEPTANATVRRAVRKWVPAELLLCVWAIGAFVTATWIALAQATMWRKLCRMTRVVPRGLTDLACAASVRLGMSHSPEIILTESYGPAVCGLFRPQILLPANLAREAPPEKLQTILAHELIHVRRGDLYVAVLQTLVQSVWWFHPLVWWASRETSRQRERCCDLEVLGSGLCAPADYAQCLIDTIRFQRLIRLGVVPLGLTAYHVNRQRLEDIMQVPSVGRAGYRRLTVTVVLLAGLVFLPGLSTGRAVTQTAVPQDAKPSYESHGFEIAGAVFNADPQVDGEAKTDAKKATPKPAANSMQITVLGPDDKPLAGAKIHASIWTKEPFQANRDYVCDAQGRATVERPKTIDILRLWASQDGHVSLFANWWPAREARPRKIPQEFTFRLEKGTVIGGIVKDEDGQPIAGAKVGVMLVDPNRENGLDQHPIPNIWLAELDSRRTTDAQGRWKLDTAPAGDEFGFKIMLNHPDHISDYSWGGLQDEQAVGAESLRDGTATIVMHRGIKLSGVVVDAEKKAVADAVIIWGDDPYLQQGSQEVRTNAKGRYQFPPLPAGTLNVTVVGAGWAPQQRTVELAPGESTADFALKPGKKLRLHFVDDDGAEIPGVGVGIDSWRGGKALYNHKHPNVLDTKIPVAADNNGLYEWTWAPDDEVTFNFYKEGYRELRNLKFTADDETEYDVTLSKIGGARK